MAGVNANGVAVLYQNFSFDIKILHCGQETDPNHLLVNKKIDRYTLSYITDGAGFYSIKNKFYNIKKGDVYYIPPAQVYSQRTDISNRYTYIYISINGSSAEHLFKMAGFSAENPVIQVTNPDVEQKFREVFDLCCQNTFSSIARANVKFFEILCYFFSKIESNNKKLKFAKSQLVEKAQTYIEENYFKDLTVDKIARHILFNKSYLSKVFKNVCKISLIEYLINFRLEKAMDMLINTNISADAISEKVGFKDYANFYRHFKKKVGCSPKVYRQENLSTIDSIEDFSPTSK